MTRSEAERRLRELVSELGRLRVDFERAKSNEDAAGGANARRAIRIQETLIRSHCAENGLPRPADVPESD